VITRGYAQRFVELLRAALVLSLIFFAVPHARADDNYRAKCRQRIEKAEFRLDKAIRAHGLESHQAHERRAQLRSERQRCWKRERAWWDGRSQSWRSDQDWDRFDSDRDHDQH
jgi:hypothetical protein